MLATMQDVPLLISRILTHGSTVHGSSQVITWTGEPEPRRRTFAEIGDRAAQLAHALRDELGGDRGTTGWPRSCGTTPSTSRRTSRSPPWAPCCTR
ncbi:hypothetical protein LT493_38765 [Streptomyces tricolor]|nr:hypothetical protein [Streptomyces tricolor]